MVDYGFMFFNSIETAATMQDPRQLNQQRSTKLTKVYGPKCPALLLLFLCYVKVKNSKTKLVIDDILMRNSG